MAWSERQHALLRGIGLRLWSAPAREAEMPVESPAPTADVASPAPTRAAAPIQAAPAAAPRVAAPPPATVPIGLRREIPPGLGWDALRDTVAGCSACGLAGSRTQTVFGVGHPQAQWLIVGEAPGEEEDARGEPFVGASGQLLDRMLAALRLTRSTEGEAPASQRVYIANTLKCRPPRNRNPQPEELAACEPFLVRQIELLQPRIILAMGKFAIQSLLRSNEAVGKLRGRVHQYQGVPLVVTYHPAYLLRNLPDKARAWEDLCLAAEVAERLG